MTQKPWKNFEEYITGRITVIGDMLDLLRDYKEGSDPSYIVDYLESAENLNETHDKDLGSIHQAIDVIDAFLDNKYAYSKKMTAFSKKNI